MRNSKKTCLIIPCFNEEKRLDVDQFKHHCSENLIFVFVNDGSTDQTRSLLESESRRNWHVVHLPVNRGKCEAIRQGALFIRQQDFFQDLSWIGFWDSDLSVPLEELDNFFTYASHFSDDADCIIGSRVRRMGSNIFRSAGRHYLGRCFCTLVSHLFSIHYYDTQCGAKVFKKDLLEVGFSQPFVSNWIFDIELLLRLQQNNIIEYPLQVWEEKPGSKIKFTTVWLEVLMDLFRIKRRARPN